MISRNSKSRVESEAISIRTFSNLSSLGSMHTVSQNSIGNEHKSKEVSEVAPQETFSALPKKLE